MRLRGLALATALLALVSALAGAQQGLHGVVRDSASGVPLPGAVVQLLGTDTVLSRGLTNDAGRYELRQNSAQRTLEIRHVGYRPRVVSLNGLAADGTLDVELTRLPVQLEPVLVRG